VRKFQVKFWPTPAPHFGTFLIPTQELPKKNALLGPSQNILSSPIPK